MKSSGQTLGNEEAPRASLPLPEVTRSNRADHANSRSESGSRVCHLTRVSTLRPTSRDRSIMFPLTNESTEIRKGFQGDCDDVVQVDHQVFEYRYKGH